MTTVVATDSTIPSCTDCAGTGTTIIAIIALVLVIILIILGIVFFIYPSRATLLEVRGTNFIVTPGKSTGGTAGVTGGTGSTGATGGTADLETFDTGANYLYISKALTGPLNLQIQPNSHNFVGMTIGIKNTSATGGGVITLTEGSGVTLEPSAPPLDLLVPPGDFAWMVVTGDQTFLRLTMVT